jgi:uncharacterized peroxidase-related enzyme
LVDAVHKEWRTAPVSDRQRAILAFVEKLTLEAGEVTRDDVAALRMAGLSDAAIEDAIAVCALFSVVTRLADALHFDVPSPESFARSAKVLLKRGYD